MANIVKVGIADLNTVAAPDGITTLGLGSCVGVAIRDPIKKVGGLVHVMLPSSQEFKTVGNICKYADTGIDELVKRIIAIGGVKTRFVAKIAGGAQMFDFQKKSDLIRVGDRNVEACKAKLKSLGIRILAEDTGANYGRTVVFYPETGDYIVKAVGKAEIKI